MTKEELAAKLNGREYGDEITDEEAKLAKRHGLIVIYGASDDLTEFDGAIHDEAGANDGGTHLLDKKGLLPERDQIDDDEALENWFKRKRKAAMVEALWCKEPGYSWTYKTELPHSDFEIVEDGKPYCRGIVLDASALPSL